MKQRFLLTMMLWLSLLVSTWAQSNNTLHFDGNNDYVTCPAINPYNFTVSAWICPTALGKDQAIISTLSEMYLSGLELHVADDNFPVITVHNGNTWIDVKATTAVTVNIWTHLAATYDGTSLKIYVNGVLSNSTTTTYALGSRVLTLGRRSSTISGFYNGKMDEVNIWNKDLDATEITAAKQNGLSGTETGLMAYYKFDQGTAAGDNSGQKSLTDATTNGNHGTLTDFALTGSTSNWVEFFTNLLTGEGSSANPFVIATAENLIWLSQNSSIWAKGYCYTQTADIDLSEITDWIPIGNSTIKFNGTYDGSGYTIQNLTINSTETDRAMFGYTEGNSVIKNLTIENSNVITTADYASIFVANMAGTISNCHTRGGTVTAANYAGGISARGNGLIEDCSNSASIGVTKVYAAGMVAYMSIGTIRRCSNSGTISSASSNANIGGMVGYIGYSGLTNAAVCTIENCYNTGAISTSGTRAGGMVGLCGGVNMSKCYSTGTVTGGSYIGGLIGYCDDRWYNNISNSYCLQSPIMGYYVSGLYTYLTGVNIKTTTQLQTQSTFSGWDFVGEAVNGTYDYWAITSGFNGGYPTLGNLAATCTNGVVDLSRQPSENVYSWYKTNGTKLTKGVDYIVENGMYKFIKLPSSKIYCTVTNATFPTWIARTNAVTVDKVVELIPNITFVSEKNGNLGFKVKVSTNGKVYVDSGNGTLVPFDIATTPTSISTTGYTAGNTVKIYGENITYLEFFDMALSALDVSNTPTLDQLDCYYNNLSTLDVSKNTIMRFLLCFNNRLSTLDLSQNTALKQISCENNRISFAGLPQPQGFYSYYKYAPQANLPATCTGGVVDLSSQLTAKDASGTTQTTVYTWYNADGTALVKGTDYDGKDGKFYFMKQPASTVYCNMTNAAFPDLTLRTSDIAVDAVLTPEITFASESYTGSILMGISNTENTTFYVDEGDGERKAYTANTNGIAIEIAAYTAGNTVKIFGDKIKHLAVVQPVLSTLDVSKATTLMELYCQNQLLNFQTLPQSKYSYFKYEYAPQAQFAATCTDGIVDLSSQLTAKDKNDQVQTTVYTWYNADGTELVKGVDYEGKDGKFYFMKQPASTVYCTMYNAAFPDLSGDNAFRTVDITVDKVLVPQITFISENSGNLSFEASATVACKVYVDWGDGALATCDVSSFTKISTTAYITGKTVKVFGENIYLFSASYIGLTTLDVSNNPVLNTISCHDNRLSSLDVSKNTVLQVLYCENNNLQSLIVTNSPTFKFLACYNNQFTFATLPQNKFSEDYVYTPQANLPATCTNGVVDLSSQLTAKDVNDQIQTTVYTWYKTDGTTLTANVDYIEDNGVFTFIKMPATAVYCQMYNAAFPDLSGEKAFRTVDMTVDAVLEPSITFVSDNTGYLSFSTALQDAGKVYVDWGNGIMVPNSLTTSEATITTTNYTAGSTVKIYGNNIDRFLAPNSGMNALNINKVLPSSEIVCFSNNLNFGSLPVNDPRYGSYAYSPQNKHSVTCVNGVVDLTSQLTAVDVNGDTQTTAYSWFLANDTPLTAGTDYIEEAGVFTFVKMPAQAVYCTMTNAAFPALTLRTLDMTVDAVAEPNITLVSENNGDLSVYLNVSEHNTVYVDWGNGVLESLQYRVGYPDNDIATTEYVANSIVKIYGKSINYINATSKGLTSLNISKASELTELHCGNNKLTSIDVRQNALLEALSIDKNRLNFVTLPQRKNTYFENSFERYAYDPQANLPATCTNGVVDLSSQLTATDIDGNLQSTSYACFKADNTALTEGADYMVNQGKIYFLTVPASDVYCNMKNDAFPNLTLRTADFTVDRPATLPEPTITFISENNGSVSIALANNDITFRSAYIDWGNGIIVQHPIFNSPNTISTTSYVAGQTVKIYADDIRQFRAVAQGITNLDVSKCTTLTVLDCSQNSLTALNVANNTELTILNCYINNLGALDVKNNIKLQYLRCFNNADLSELNLRNNTALRFLNVSECALSSLDVSYNTALKELYLAMNQIATLDIRQHTALTGLGCNKNRLTTLDISRNTLLTELSVEENRMDFASLPKPKASFMSDYRYAPQANLAATCTDGIVDLSSQQTAVDVDGNTQTTVYSWYLSDGTALTNNYMSENGVFRFVLEPGTVVYCQMDNAAFPALNLRTENITIDAKATLPEPTISFVSENSGNLSFGFNVSETSTVYFDWGNGILNSNTYSKGNPDYNLQTSDYVAGSTVKIYGGNISSLNVYSQGIKNLDVSKASELTALYCDDNKLTSLDVSKNTGLIGLSCGYNQISVLNLSQNTLLTELSVNDNILTSLGLSHNTALTQLYCNNNSIGNLDLIAHTALHTLNVSSNKFNIASLPVWKSHYHTYYYDPQANIAATCTNGVVDLSSQLTAVDKEGATQTTVYTWYKTGNSSSLHKGTDYVEYNGVFRFLQQPDTTVYCQMKNAAFPSLTLGTEPIAIDDVVKPSITLVSEMSGDFTFGVTSSENGTIYIDGGYGELLAYNVLDQVGMSMLVTDYSASQTVRIFENSLNTLTVSNLGLTYLNVSESNSLKTLDCSNNMLSSLDLSQNKELATLNCASNNLTFATLPQPSASYTSFVYAPQANLNVPCSNGMVDLSAQRTAIDANGNTQTTVYTWYRTDGYQLIEDTHYFNLNGVFVFRFVPSEQVYCTMTNAAFPGLTLRTEDITVDAEASAPIVWLGTVDTDWHTAGNWAGGVPSTIDYIEISSTASNQPVISSSVNASFLSIESGAKVTIAPTGSLRVYESLINNRGTEGLVIKSDATGTGKLIYKKAGVQATLEQYIVKDQWHYITSPVVEALNVNPLFKNFYAVSHTEAQSEGNNNGNCWNYLYTGDQIVAGTGYGVQYNRKDSDNDTIVTFRGELVGPEYVIATQYTGANFGWNLVGNPYPCTISWNATQKGNIQDAVYIYDPATSNYMSYVNGLGSNGGSEFLAPMQGFFVRAKSPNTTLNINHDSKRENESSFKGVPMQSLIRLSATDAEGRKDESLVRLEPAATAQFDDAFDAYKLKATASATPQLYSVFNGDEYSINSIPEATVNTVIPFELLVKTTGTQQIAATELTGLDATLDVVLEDLQTGERTLLANSAYRFSATAGETRKFNLLFADATNVTRVEARTIKAYGAENRMCISNMSDGRNIVAVYNLNGQLVLQTNPEGSYTEVELPNGLYVVKVTPENGNVFNGKVRIGSFK